MINESMRIRPVVPFTGRQLREPADLGGHELPDGAVVMAGIYLTHMRDDVYPRRPLVPARALPGRRARDVLVDPVRRRHPPLPGSRVRAVRDARRAADHSARRRAASRRRRAGADRPAQRHARARRREPARSSSAGSSYSSSSRRASTSGTCSR